MKSPVFIIEHLEPELWEWCLIEYQHISQIAGKNNVWFTNVKKENVKKLKKYGRVFSKSIKTLCLKNLAVLEPKAKKFLTPSRAKEFNYFVFGGILGDNPPKNRTTFELAQFLKNSEAFNIGKEQMSTDNAVFVVKQIINGANISEINFQDNIDIKINDIESTILPYRYVVLRGRPLISKDLIAYLKKENKKKF